MKNPKFMLLAQAMGMHTICYDNAAELPGKVKEVLEYDGSRPVLMECGMDREECVS
jgi:acetolactate synthase-1/2/3 large subunit